MARITSFFSLLKVSRWLGAGSVVLAAIGLGSPAHAVPESLTISADANLRFGAFVVIASGSRTVRANGAVTNASIFPIVTVPTGPAQFTVTYDRGNQSGKPVDITFQVLMSSISAVNVNGVTGTLSSFDSDLEGAAVFVPGQAYSFTIRNCSQRACSKTFRVGGRIDVSRSSAGATLTIALPMIATLISVQKL